MKTIETEEPDQAGGDGDWNDLGARLRHRAIEAVDLITILLQDAVILVAGFATEFAYERWLHSEHPLFQLAINVSSALFLLLYVITVTVHILKYVRGAFGPRPATLLGQYVPWTLLAVVTIAVAVGLPGSLQRPSQGAPEMRTEFQRQQDIDRGAIRFLVSPPEGSALGNRGRGGGPYEPNFAASPDGRRLAYVAITSGKMQLWIRPLNSLTSQSLAGTEGASFPFWSPDSRFVAFFAEGKLKKIDVSGGPPQIVCDAPDGQGGSWNQHGMIVFAPTAFGTLMQVSAAGGAPAAVTTLDTSLNENFHRWPQFLPDGRHFMYLGGGKESGIYVGSLETPNRKQILKGDLRAAYASGRLFFVQKDVLMAQIFDATNFELTGEAFPVAEQVAFSLDRAGFSVSEGGVLAYRNDDFLGRTRLLWFDRTGKQVSEIALAASLYQNLELSPDRQRLALQRQGSPIPDIWIIELARGAASRFTFDGSNFPVWSPDGSRTAFMSFRIGGVGLYMKSSTGVGKDQLLLRTEPFLYPSDWSPDGQFIIYQKPQKTGPLWVLPLSGERQPFPFSQTSFEETEAKFSPDGRWLAYVSNESGREEVYVQSFPSGGGKWQISTNGGNQPRWRTDGKELFYVSADQMLMAVDVKTSNAIEAGIPRALFETGISETRNMGFVGFQYDVTADGKRFIVSVPEKQATNPPINVVVNWDAGLKR